MTWDRLQCLRLIMHYKQQNRVPMYELSCVSARLYHSSETSLLTPKQAEVSLFVSYRRIIYISEYFHKNRFHFLLSPVVSLKESGRYMHHLLKH